MFFLCAKRTYNRLWVCRAQNSRQFVLYCIFFGNLLISEKTVIFEHGINKRGPEYLKHWFRYFEGFPNCFKKSTFIFFPAYHLIPEICQGEQLGEQNIVQNALNRNTYFFERHFFWKHKLIFFFWHGEIRHFFHLRRPFLKEME